jgi:N-acetylmuramic acid 6-phosphate etherase
MLDSVDRTTRTGGIDEASAEEIVDLMAAGRDGPLAVAQARTEIARTIELIEAFRAGGRLRSAPYQRPASACLTLGMPANVRIPAEMVAWIIAGGLPALVKPAEGAEDDVNLGISAMDERQVSARDVVVGIAASGTTPYVRAALGRARPGRRTVFLSRSEPPAHPRDVRRASPSRRAGSRRLTGSGRHRDQARAQHAHDRRVIRIGRPTAT